MIVAYLQGGLGNQLFQYAFAKSLADRHGVGVVVDTDWFDNPLPGETRRVFELSAMRAPFEVANLADRRRWRLMRQRLSRYIPSFAMPLTLVQERGEGFDLKAWNAPDGSYLRGFWQSERYFSDAASTIAAALEPNRPVPLGAMTLATNSDGKQSVSVHVRRGDYVTLPSAAQFHGTCGIDYYRDGAAYLMEKVGACRFFIFSDDPEWAQANIQLNAETHVVSDGGESDAVGDLWRMSQCRHHIIANSSFSWWGAWLSEQRNPGGVVIAPQRWFAGRSAPDLVPDRWVRL